MAKRTKTKTKARLEAENRVMLEALQRIVAYTVDNVPEEHRKDEPYSYAFGWVKGDASFTIRMIEDDFPL